MAMTSSSNIGLRRAEELSTESAAQSTARRTKSSRHEHDNQTNAAAGMNDSGKDEDVSDCPSVVTKRQRQRSRKKQPGSSATTTGNAPSRTEAKLERTRQLQNLRQRRYRARKKCSVSELQQRSQQLADDNARLERAIRAMLSLQ